MRKGLREVLEELGIWWESFSEDTRRLYIAIIASLPGADDLYSAFGPSITVNIPAVGWKEVEVLTRLLSAIQDAQDVRTIAKCIMWNEWPQDPETPTVAKITLLAGAGEGYYRLTLDNGEKALTSFKVRPGDKVLVNGGWAIPAKDEEG